MNYSEIFSKLKACCKIIIQYGIKLYGDSQPYIAKAKIKLKEASESKTAHDTKVKLLNLKAWWIENFVKPTNHVEIEHHVITEGMMTSRYAFMVITACAIAILGLLLSSPAVIIGAMLISPLMSPIMALGFSLCWMDIPELKRSLITLTYGILLALGVSWLIVSCSPITEATPEILARTKPNLFDLLVAVFSGMAAGYSVIKQKGETIVGVAIATALMPPIAVTGFGLATGDANIAQGSFMLFMTNLLAIALSVTLVAKLYGFSDLDNKQHTAWQMTLILAVFGILSLPLGVALKTIAYQTYITKTSQNILNEYFQTASDQSRITSFNIHFNNDGKINLDTVVLTSHYKQKAEKKLQALLQESVNADIHISLDQVVVAQEDIAQDTNIKTTENALGASTFSQAQQNLTPTQSPVDTMRENLKKSIFFPTEYIEVNNDKKQASIYARPFKGVTISTLRQIESNFKNIYPEWDIKLIPPIQALPNIIYHGNSKLSKREFSKLNDIVWSLSRWNLQNIEIVAYVRTLEEFRYFEKKLPAHKRSLQLQEFFEKLNIQTTITHELYKLEYLEEIRLKQQDNLADYLSIRIPILDEEIEPLLNNKPQEEAVKKESSKQTSLNKKSQ